MKNIDLQALPWTPIGNLLNKTTSSTYNFEGHFDGNNCCIYNLEITNEDSALYKSYIGLFGYVGKNAVISNLSIGDSAIDITEVTGQSYYVGLLAGYIGTYTTITNCFTKSSSVYVDGYTSSSYKTYIAGMFGYVDKHSTITNCIVDNDVIVELGNCSTTYVGGFASYADEYALVTGVTSKGKVVTNNKPTSSTYGTLTVGGLFGYLGSYSNKTKLVNYSNLDITNTYDVIVGGLIGSFGNSNALTELIESNNEGLISIKACQAATVGGLFGKSTNAKATSCYNVGTINCSKVSGKAYVGGLAGDNLTAYCCYQNGSINVEFAADKAAYVGGLIGDSGTCEECYSTGTFIVKNTNRKYSSVYLNGISNDPSKITKCFSSVDLRLTIETLTIKSGSPQFPSTLYLGYLCGYNSRLIPEGNGCSGCSANVNGYSFVNKDDGYIDESISIPRDINYNEEYWSWRNGVFFPILKRS